MIWPAFKLTLRLRLPSTGLAALGLVAVLLIVGALFPAVGHSFGKLNLPQGVSHLLGGADYSTITGWYRSEIGSIYGPLVISAMAITGVVGATAGEEEDRILALVLAHPVERSHLIAAKAAAIAAVVCLIAVATWLGLIAGVALAGGGISLGDLSAYSLGVRLEFASDPAGDEGRREPRRNGGSHRPDQGAVGSLPRQEMWVCRSAITLTRRWQPPAFRRPFDS